MDDGSLQKDWVFAVLLMLPCFHITAIVFMSIINLVCCIKHPDPNYLIETGGWNDEDVG